MMVSSAIRLKYRCNMEILKIILVIFGYCSVSIILVFANKYLVGNQQSKVDLSLFVVWVQCIVTVLFVTCINFTNAIWQKDSKFLRVPYEKLLSWPIFRMSCTFVTMLAFNNLCLRYVDVSFYQVARSMTIIFVVILSIVLLKKSVSWRVILCCTIVAMGFFLGVDQEKLLGTLSARGVFYGVMSSVFVALNGIFIKQALDIADGDSYLVTYLGNINACFLFIPIVYLTGQYQQAASSINEWGIGFWILLISTGILCFLIAWIGGIQINLTSPITHHIIANTKAIVQTLLAVMYYKESKPALWWLSVVLVVGGAFAYTMIKIREEAPEQNKKNLVSASQSDVESQAKQNLPNGSVSMKI